MHVRLALATLARKGPTRPLQRARRMWQHHRLRQGYVLEPFVLGPRVTERPSLIKSDRPKCGQRRHGHDLWILRQCHWYPQDGLLLVEGRGHQMPIGHRRCRCASRISGLEETKLCGGKH